MENVHKSQKKSDIGMYWMEEHILYYKYYLQVLDND